MINYRIQSRFKKFNRFFIAGRNVSYFYFGEIMFNKKEYNKEWNRNHTNYKKEYNKRYLQENEGYYKKYYKKNREKLLKYNKKYRENNPDKIKIIYHRYYINNLDKAKAYVKSVYIKRTLYIKIYNQEHKEERNKNRRDRYKTDLKYNLNYKMSSGIGRSLKRNKVGRHWEKLVGYTLNDLIRHLKKNMPKNYTWGDYINGDLHIDHIIPIDAFNYTKPEHIDFKRCWALSNLQLLSAKENLVKNNKLTKSFQPALQM